MLIDNIENIGNVIKLFVGIVISIVSIILTIRYKNQHLKSRSEVLDKFEKAVASGFIHSVTELFRLLHGLNMKYTDIVSLIKKDECTNMILTLKKTPGLVKYENEKYQYTRKYSTTSMFILGKVIPNFFLFMLSLLWLSLITLAWLTDGKTSLTYWVMTIGASMILGGLIKQIQYNKLIRKLMKANK